LNNFSALKVKNLSLLILIIAVQSYKKIRHPTISLPVFLLAQEIIETSVIQHIRNALKCANHHGTKRGVLTKAAMDEVAMFRNTTHFDADYKKDDLNFQLEAVSATWKQMGAIWDKLQVQMGVLVESAREKEEMLELERRTLFEIFEDEMKDLKKEIEDINVMLKKEVQEEKEIFNKQQQDFDQITKKIDNFHTENKVVLDIGSCKNMLFVD
jgi:hypothetical protein